MAARNCKDDANVPAKSKNAPVSPVPPARGEEDHASCMQCAGETAEGIRCKRTMERENMQFSQVDWMCFQHAVKCSKKRCMGVFSDPNWVFCPACASPLPATPATPAAEAVASTAAAAGGTTTAAVEAAPQCIVQNTEFGDKGLPNIQILQHLSMAFWESEAYAWKATDKAEEKAKAAEAMVATAASTLASGTEAAPVVISVPNSFSPLSLRPCMYFLVVLCL